MIIIVWQKLAGDGRGNPNHEGVQRQMPRPVFTFRGFVGQRKVVDLLRRQLKGARARGEPFPPTLLKGPSGVGKTLLAKSLAQEYGSTLIGTHGTDSLEELAAAFLRAQPCDSLFVDEAHNLPAKAQELFYHIIDHGCLPSRAIESASNGDQREDPPNEPKPCTVILATDQPGKLLDALHKRMELSISLSFYSLAELKAIVDRLASNLNMLISPQASNLIAQISGGVPRRAKHHLQNLRRHFPDAEHEQVSLIRIREFLARFELDEKGLGPPEHNYLRYLRSEGKVSLESLALYLGYDTDFVRRQIEPQLQRARFITIRSGGRQITARGCEWLDQLENSQQEGH